MIWTENAKKEKEKKNKTFIKVTKKKIYNLNAANI